MLSPIQYSFPVQLLLHHFKYNQLLLLFWAILFAIVTFDFGRIFGLPFLFLDPEYMNQVTFSSMFIIGLSLGVFTMAFHISSFILSSDRFRFLCAIRQPFLRFSLNNSIIPALFMAVYSYRFVTFQSESGMQPMGEVLIQLSGAFTGYFIIVIITFTYFLFTDKNVFRILTTQVDKQLRRYKMYRVNVMKRLDIVRRHSYRIDNYFDFPFRISRAARYLPYDKEVIYQVLDQNHLNATLFGIAGFAIFIILGIFRDNAYFQIPAGASVALFFSMVIMFTGAFSYWSRGWAWTIVIAGLLFANFLVKEGIVTGDYEAFGMNYQAPRAEYTLERIRKLNSDSITQGDIAATHEILENWKRKFPANTKPRMIFVCASGGGQRAAFWTMQTLQKADSSLNGKVMDHTFLMTGASGGLIGASYFRELYLQKKQGKNINVYAPGYLDNISKDLLNPIAYSFIVNDIFFRMQTFEHGGYEYYKDRGYAFEQQLDINTSGILNKRLEDYYEPEQKAIIPMLLLAPTVINDGRKLYISPQNISYMNVVSNASTDKLISKKMRGIEFKRFFEEQDAENLGFLSALRMNATFPYVMPNVTLPSFPPMEIMDAGLTDNFGVADAVKFIYTFRKWIGANTSGVVIIRIRDTGGESSVDQSGERSMFSRMFNPVGTLYKSWNNMQDNTNNNHIEFSQAWLKAPVDVIDFQYVPSDSTIMAMDSLRMSQRDYRRAQNALKQERAALSWHLSVREKESLKNNIFEASNQTSIEKLKYLLEENEKIPQRR
jgi:hypothetical protein